MPRSPAGKLRNITAMLLMLALWAGCGGADFTSVSDSSGTVVGVPLTKKTAQKKKASPPMPRQTNRLPQFADLQPSPYPVAVEPADAWTELFRRYHGWAGADGVYSMPLDGVQIPRRSGTSTSTTLLTFGDTIVGEVDPATFKRVQPKMHHFSDALLTGNVPDADRIDFSFPGQRPGFTAIKLQRKPFQDWRFWLQDGVILNGYYYSQAMAVKGLTEDYPWWTRGTVLLKVPVTERGPAWQQAQQLPGAYRYLEHRDALVYFGVAYLEHTEQAGWANADGYLYIYGRYESAMRPFNPWEQRIELAVARVRPDELEDLSSWQYWTDEGWSPDIEQIQSLGLGGPELSVTPVEQGALAGNYLLISKHVRTDLYYRVGDSPNGPFGPALSFLFHDRRRALRVSSLHVQCEGTPTSVGT